MKVPVSELPVMVSCCKTCPFKEDENGRWQDVQLANEVSHEHFSKHNKFATERKVKEERQITDVKAHTTTTKLYMSV